MPIAAAPTHESRGLPWNWIIPVALVLLIAAGAFAVMRGLGRDEGGEEPVIGALVEPTQPSGGAVPVSSSRTPAALATEEPTERAAALPIAASPSATPTTQPTRTLPPAPTATRTLAPPTPTNTLIPRTPTASPAPTNTQPPTLTPTLFVTATLVPSATRAPVAAAPGDSPRGDVLAALVTAPASALPGSAESFSPSSDGWLLSTGTDGEALVVIPPDLLSALFQLNAANTVRRVDATLELMGYDPDALATEEVAFGLGVQNPTGQRTIVEVRYTEPGLVSMGLDQNGRFRSTTQFPRRDTSFALSVRRSSPNSLGFYVNEQWLGDSVFLYTQGEPLTLALYAAGPDVSVQVKQFTIDYSPRDDIP